MPVAPLRFRRPETYQHCRLDVLQIRETQLGLMPIRFSCSWFSSHGYHLPTRKARNGRIRHHIQFLDTAEVREYHVLNQKLDSMRLVASERRGETWRLMAKSWSKPFSHFST